MSQPLIYIDTSDVREGALEELKRAISDLSDFVETHEPRIVSYNVYFNDDGSQMTVVHVHADAASLDYHMDVAGPRFGRFADFLTLSSIHIYGEPSAKAVKQLEGKVRLLGTGEVTVQPPHAVWAVRWLRRPAGSGRRLATPAQARFCRDSRKAIEPPFTRERASQSARRDACSGRGASVRAMTTRDRLGHEGVVSSPSSNLVNSGRLGRRRPLPLPTRTGSRRARASSRKQEPGKRSSRLLHFVEAVAQSRFRKAGARLLE